MGWCLGACLGGTYISLCIYLSLVGLCWLHDTTDAVTLCLAPLLGGGLCMKCKEEVPLLIA